MPGLVGLITGMPRLRAETELLRMVNALRHEAGYVTGTWIDETLGLYLGWTAHRGSFADCMPLENERQNLVLAFSGEEYPDPGTVQRLKEKGHAAGAGGAAYLVHVAEEETDFPRRLNGRFHGVLANRTDGTVTLFNDRYGMNRVYYHEAKEAFYFAAEAKAILAVRPELRSVQPESLAEIISCGCVLENRSVFKDIHLLPPASTWVFRRRAIAQKGCYFDPVQWEEQPALDAEAFYAQLREVFSTNLPRYFSGPQRIGMSLTGGLDTRMILSWRHPAPGSLPCYSFGGMYRDSQDVQVGRRVAGACGQEYEVIRVDSDFIRQFPRYCERTVYLTDGCVDVKQSADLYVNERAAEIAPVRMTGNYGGEVLRRVRAFKPADPVPGLFHPDLSHPLERAGETYRRIAHGHPVSFAVFRQAPWHHFNLLGLEQSQLSHRSPFLDNEVVRTAFRAPSAALASDAVSLRLIADGNPGLRRIRTDRGIGGSLPAWAAAIERACLNLTFKAEYACDMGMPRRLARFDSTVARLCMERLFLGRHKFCHYRVWYRDSLASYIREMLLDARSLSRPYLQRGTVERLVREHLNENRNHTAAIHKLLTLEHLHRLFIDSV